MVGDDHALAQVIQHHQPRTPAQAAERGFVQLGPDAGTGLEPQQPDRLPAITQRHHKQPGPAILARLRVPDHRPGPVVDLGFFPRSRLNDARRGRTGHATELAHEPLDRLVAASESVIRNQILPDGHRVAATHQGRFNDLPVGLRTGRGPGRRRDR